MSDVLDAKKRSRVTRGLVTAGTFTGLDGVACFTIARTGAAAAMGSMGAAFTTARTGAAAAMGVHNGAGHAGSSNDCTSKR